MRMLALGIVPMECRTVVFYQITINVDGGETINSTPQQEYTT